MAVIEKSGVCPTHGPVLARAKGTSHILHLLLTIVTGGLWLIVWLLVSAKKKDWRCPLCGQPSHII
jgi:hypothetical protein